MATGGSNPPKTLRRSQRSNTNLMRQSLSPQKNHASLVHKNYQLNPDVAISKKKNNCLSAPITCEMKPKSNFIVKCNTASFELVKTKLYDILFSHSFQTDYVVSSEKGKDNSQNEVELRYKIHNKRRDGSSGTYHKFTINVYNTTSSLLVNVPKIDIFTESILPIIEDHIVKNIGQVNAMNNHLNIAMSTKNAQEVEINVENQLSCSDTGTKGQTPESAIVLVRPNITPSASVDIIYLLSCMQPCNENELYNTTNSYQESTSQNNNNSHSLMTKEQPTTSIQKLADMPFLESKIITNSDKTLELSPAKTPSSVSTSAQNNFSPKKVIQGHRDLSGELTQSTVQSSSSIQKPIEETPKSHDSNATSDHQMRPKQSARQKTTTKSIENKTYIIELEKRIREHEKTINLFEKREELRSENYGSSNQTNRPSYSCTCSNQNQSSQELYFLNIQRQMEIQAMEMRLKALETQTMQNLSIQTAMTTQLALQIQQQTIAKLQYPANLPTYIAPPSYTQPQHYSYTTPPYFHQNIQPPQMPLSGPSISMSHPRHMTPPNMFINHPPPLHPNYNMAAHSQTNMSTNQQIHSNREFSLPPQSSTAQPFMSNANVQNVQILSQHLHDTTDRSPKEMYQNNQKVSSIRKIDMLQIQVSKVEKDQQPDLLDQSAWMFQAKLANRSGNNNRTAETADIEQNKQNQRNERSNQGSDQSAWMFQAKLATDPVNNNTNRDHLNGKQNLDTIFYAFRLGKRHQTLLRTI
ncbi:unnamed protein product [Mytilus edulis]|uniref:Uncharacterized protein n=1 Tax=Mytilus edulis TaxID=6550 RepID=A0A8S3S6E8_MYTED|nr:unnamed protein product [Mytilus edulis]